MPKYYITRLKTNRIPFFPATLKNSINANRVYETCKMQMSSFIDKYFIFPKDQFHSNKRGYLGVFNFPKDKSNLAMYRFDIVQHAQMISWNNNNFPL